VQFTGVASIFHKSISVFDWWSTATKHCSDWRPIWTKFPPQPCTQKHRYSSPSIKTFVHDRYL